LDDYCETFSQSGAHQVGREALTAGYVLASACNLGWKHLRQWSRYCSNMRPVNHRPHKLWPQGEESQLDRSNSQNSLLPALSINGKDPIGPYDRVKFAALLARFTPSRPISYHELVRAAVAESKPRSLTEIEKQEVKSAMTSADELSALIAELESKVVFDPHLVPRFEDPVAASTLSLHLPPSELNTLASSCLLRDARRKDRTAELGNK
jgi:hypothetical protein